MNPNISYDLAKVRSVMLEVPVSGAAGTGNFRIPTNPQLRDAAALLSVEVFNTTLMAKGPSGKTNIADAAYKTTTLTIINSGNVVMRQDIPAAKLIRSVSSAPIKEMNIFRGGNNSENPIDPERSYFTIGDLSTLGGGTIILAEFTYLQK